MLDKLTEKHAEVQTNLLEHRVLLTQERGVIEKKLIEVRKQLISVQSSMDKLLLDHTKGNPETNSNLDLYSDDDEPIEHAFETAIEIQQNIKECLSRIQSRITVLQQESQWLNTLPDNAIWKGMQQRLNDSLDAIHGMSSSNVEMTEYLNYITDKANISTKEEVKQLFNRVTYAICQDIIKEVESGEVNDVCSSIVNTIASCDAQLENFIINVSSRLNPLHSSLCLLFSSCIR